METRKTNYSEILSRLGRFLLSAWVVLIFSAAAMADETGTGKAAQPAGSFEVSLSEYQQAFRKAMDLLFDILQNFEKEDEVNLEEKKRDAIDFLRYIRWGPEKKYYFWIIDLDGKMILEPLFPHIEGTNVLSLKDLNQKEIFVEFIKASLSSEYGFVDHHGKGYDDNKSDPMLNLVRLFKMWGWVVGIGVEIAPVEPYEQQKVYTPPGFEFIFPPEITFPPIDEEFPVDDQGPPIDDNVPASPV